MNTDFLNKIPEFSNKNFTIATYASAAIIGCASLFFIYMMFVTPDFGISTQWNMFKSSLFGPLYVIGLICAIVNWGKFTHWSATPIIETRDSSGNVIKREKNYDIMETLFAQILLPILGHFLIEPCIYAAIIYYPIMCVVALVAAILPYFLTVILVAITACIAVYGKKLVTVRNHSLIIVLLTIVLGGGLSYAAYVMNQQPAAVEPAPTEEQQTEQQTEQQPAQHEQQSVETPTSDNTSNPEQTTPAEPTTTEPAAVDEDDSDLDNVPSEELWGE